MSGYESLLKKNPSDIIRYILKNNDLGVQSADIEKEFGMKKGKVQYHIDKIRSLLRQERKGAQMFLYIKEEHIETVKEFDSIAEELDKILP